MPSAAGETPALPGRKGPGLLAWSLLALLTLAACGGGKPAPEPAGKKDEAKAKKEGVRFEENAGLVVPAETRRALGVTFAPAGEGRFRRPVEFRVQVYRPAAETPDERTRAGHAYASGALPVAAAETLAAGQTVTLHPEGANGDASETLAGTITALDRQTERASGQTEILVETAPDPTGRLRLGTTLRARVETGAATPAATIPRAALLTTVEGRFVYVENGEALQRRPVEVGGEEGDNVAITGGLRAGESVVTAPVEDALPHGVEGNPRHGRRRLDPAAHS